MTMVMSGKRQRPARRNKTLLPEMIAAVRQAGEEQGVSPVQRAIGVLGSGYYAAINGSPVSETTYRKFETWYREQKTK